MSNHEHFFAESFDGYTSAAEATALNVFTSQSLSGNGASQFIGAYGRRGRNGVRFAFTNHSGIGFLNSLSKAMPGVNDTCIFSFGFRYSGPHFANAPIFYVQDTGVTQCCLVLNLDGTFSVYRGDFGTSPAPTLLGTSSFSVSAGTYVNVNGRIKIHNSTGTVDIWFNGSNAPDISLTSKNTRATGVAQWTGFSIGLRWLSNLFSGTPTLNWDFCDLIVKDSTIALGGGVGATDPLGDAEVNWLATQTGNGHYVDWTPLTGSNHGAMVLEVPNDGDGSYNQGSISSGVRDSYLTAALPTSGGTILAVVVAEIMKKSTSGTSLVTPFVRSASVNTSGDATHVLADEYKRYNSVFFDFGGTPITPELVNAMESGPLTA